MLRVLLTSFFIILAQMQICLGGETEFSSERLQQNTPVKCHIFADQISLCEEGIIIHLENVCLLAQSVFHDENGYYYLEEGIYWICRNCGALNDLDNKICYKCGES